MATIKQLTILLFAVFMSTTTKAQAPKTYHSAEILQQLRKLKVLGAVLYVAAHPDDENTRLLAYLANEKLYRTGYLSLTRGDGGQNLIGDEQGIDLGLIRTQELLAARRIDGAEQLFSRAYDFGYSKSPEETMRTWGKEAILGDVVWVIRQFKPDVIICRFPTTGEGGHGHHTASAILAEEAFDAAADPNRFPEQLQNGVTVWKAKRLLWNTFSFGSTNTQREDQFKIDVGQYNPLLGKSYGELAAQSRSQHKSQGFGVPAQRGSQIEYFKTIKGEAPVKDLMDGVDNTWARVNPSSALPLSIDSLIAGFSTLQPERSASGLIQISQQLLAMQQQGLTMTDHNPVQGKDMGTSSSVINDVARYWVNLKIREASRMIAACMGIYTEATVANQLNVKGDSMRISLSVINRSSLPLNRVSVQAMGGSAQFDSIGNNIARSKNITVYLSETAPSSQPYWLEQGLDSGRFVVSTKTKIGMPEDQPYYATFSTLINNVPVEIRQPIQYKYTDPVKGELFEPMQVVNPVFISTTPSFLLFNTNVKKQTRKVNIDLQFNSKLTDSSNLMYYIGSERVNVFDSLLSVGKGDKKRFTLNLAQPSAAAGNPAMLSPVFKNKWLKTEQEMTLRKIAYDHIPDIYYHYRDPVKIVPVDLKTSGSTAGYIVGAGDKVPEALEQMGYKVTLLREADITTSNLRQFDVVITGIRAYNTNDWMNNVYETLMQYVKEGGTMVVQYNTSNQIGPVRAKISPYPFSISRNRITDENATVNFLQPDHPVLNFPNKITGADFNGWIQERSIYHAEKADSNYRSILSIADPGEKADNGALIVTDYGKGRFVYTGLVFFRELPAGVPGAYRLFANLIANKGRRYFK